MRRLAWLLSLAVAGCGSVSEDGADPDSGPQGSIDAGDQADAGETAACRHTDPFEGIAPVPGVNTGNDEYNAWLSADEKTILFTRWPADDNVGDFFIAVRDTPDGDFADGDPVSVNTGDDEWRAWLSADLRTIYFDRGPAAGGEYDILSATRTSPAGDFGDATTIPNVTDPDATEIDPFVTADGIYFSKSVSGNSQVFFAPAEGDGFGPASAGIGINSLSKDEFPVPSSDELALYFGAQDRGPDGASWDIWVGTRADTSGPFELPSRLAAPVNAAGGEYPSWLSPDNCRLYFTTDANGDHDIWVATRTPPG